jgi:hypothetical protein
MIAMAFGLLFMWTMFDIPNWVKAAITTVCIIYLSDHEGWWW